jgi:hypothetical protein
MKLQITANIILHWHRLKSISKRVSVRSLPGRHKILKRISVAVEAFEKVKFPMPVATTIPDLLEEYMHDNKLINLNFPNY